MPASTKRNEFNLTNKLGKFVKKTSILPKYHLSGMYERRSNDAIKIPLVNDTADVSLKRIDYGNQGNSISRNPKIGRFNRSTRLVGSVVGASNKRKIMR